VHRFQAVESGYSRHPSYHPFESHSGRTTRPWVGSQNDIPATWRDRKSLRMRVIELDNTLQSQTISQLSHLCYIRITVELYKGRTAPPQCARCRQIFRPLRLAPAVQRSIARGNAKNISKWTSYRSELCVKSVITARSTDVALISVTSWKRRWATNLSLRC
jgi:hypothetical protein